MEQTEVQLGHGRHIIRDKEAHRNNRQIGKVVEAIASDDGEVTKANVLVCKEGVRKTHLRAISEVVLIVESQDCADVN